jgi:ABC-type dipeptide/oligopeptide/nickel transport system permease subunit
LAAASTFAAAIAALVKIALATPHLTVLALASLAFAISYGIAGTLLGVIPWSDIARRVRAPTRFDLARS